MKREPKDQQNCLQSDNLATTLEDIHVTATHDLACAIKHPHLKRSDNAFVESRVQLAKATCHAQGIRFTPLREQVYRFILQAQKPIGAYDLLSQLQSLSDKSVAPPTVYRSLDFLLAQGFIHQLNSTKAFFACCQPDGQHTAAFLICQCCGDVQEFSHSPIRDMLHDVAKQSDFAIHSSVIELSGLCLQCQKNC